MSSIKIKFVSRKINKVRFQPKNSSFFVTGSYNDENNYLSIWKFPEQVLLSDDHDAEAEDEPIKICSEKFKGCVTDLKVVSDELIFASSSHGSVSAFTHSKQDLKCMHSWQNVHSFKSAPAATTGISVKGNELASVGEDGKLCLFNFQGEKEVRKIESSDLCSFTCVTHLRHLEIVAGNCLGFLRLWDMRADSNAPSRLLSLSREWKGIVSSAAVHPAQSHILATGFEDGSLCIWDMRQEKKPMSIMDGHSAAVSELMFHPTNPDFMFTCSLDGSVWQWDATNIKSAAPTFTGFGDSKDLSAVSFNVDGKGNPWLNCDANKHKLEVTALSTQSWSCINSLDITGSVLIWSTDNEELCIQNDIMV